MVLPWANPVNVVEIQRHLLDSLEAGVNAPKDRIVLKFQPRA